MKRGAPLYEGVLEFWEEGRHFLRREVGAPFLLREELRRRPIWNPIPYGAWSLDRLEEKSNVEKSKCGKFHEENSTKKIPRRKVNCGKVHMKKSPLEEKST